MLNGVLNVVIDIFSPSHFICIYNSILELVNPFNNKTSAYDFFDELHKHYYTNNLSNNHIYSFIANIFGDRIYTSLYIVDSTLKYLYNIKFYDLYFGIYYSNLIFINNKFLFILFFSFLRLIFWFFLVDISNFINNYIDFDLYYIFNILIIIRYFMIFMNFLYKCCNFGFISIILSIVSYIYLLIKNIWDTSILLIFLLSFDFIYRVILYCNFNV